MDELNLQPDVIKVDSEGDDFRILKGARETLKRCRPFILLENQEENYLDFVRFVNALRMEVFFYDYQKDMLFQSQESPTMDKNYQRNIVVIPQERIEEVKARMAARK